MISYPEQCEQVLEQVVATFNHIGVDVVCPGKAVNQRPSGNFSRRSATSVMLLL